MYTVHQTTDNIYYMYRLLHSRRSPSCFTDLVMTEGKAQGDYRCTPKVSVAYASTKAIVSVSAQNSCSFACNL